MSTKEGNITITRGDKVLMGYEASCSCGWVGPWDDALSMAGFEFCPSCYKRYAGFMPHIWVDQRHQIVTLDTQALI